MQVKGKPRKSTIVRFQVLIGEKHYQKTTTKKKKSLFRGRRNTLLRKRPQKEKGVNGKNSIDDSLKRKLVKNCRSRNEIGYIKRLK